MPPRRILAALAATAALLASNASADESPALSRIEITGNSISSCGLIDTSVSSVTKRDVGQFGHALYAPGGDHPRTT